MRKAIIYIVCVLFLCGGLFGIHLAAQISGLGGVRPAAVSVSLLDPKIKECSERELLELKVASYRKLADLAAAQSEIGSRAGTAVRLAESHADLAAAEIELYRHTGEREKLRTALKTRVEALTDKLQAVTTAQEFFGAARSDEVYAAEVQLLDALLEQKRVHASLKESVP